MSCKQNRIVIAEIGAAHGLRGAARLRLFAHDLASFERLANFRDEQGREYCLRSVRAGKNIQEAIAEFVGIDNRDHIEILRGQKLYVYRDALPDTEWEEFYHTDLIGLDAYAEEDNNLLGNVTALYNFGAGDIIEITTMAGQEVMHPFNEQFIPLVDLEAGRITLRAFASDDKK